MNSKFNKTGAKWNNIFKGKYNNAKCNSIEFTWTNTILSKMLQLCCGENPLVKYHCYCCNRHKRPNNLNNNSFSWKDNNGVELDNYLLTRASGKA